MYGARWDCFPSFKFPGTHPTRFSKANTIGLIRATRARDPRQFCNSIVTVCCPGAATAGRGNKRGPLDFDRQNGLPPAGSRNRLYAAPCTENRLSGHRWYPACPVRAVRPGAKPSNNNSARGSRIRNRLSQCRNRDRRAVSLARLSRYFTSARISASGSLRSGRAASLFTISSSARHARPPPDCVLRLSWKRSVVPCSCSR